MTEESIRVMTETQACGNWQFLIYKKPLGFSNPCGKRNCIIENLAGLVYTHFYVGKKCKEKENGNRACTLAFGCSAHSYNFPYKSRQNCKQLKGDWFFQQDRLKDS